MIHLPRRDQPYITREINYFDFLVFKALFQDLRIFSGREADAKSKSGKINWIKISSKFLSYYPFLILISFSNDAFCVNYYFVIQPLGEYFSYTFFTKKCRYCKNKGLQIKLIATKLPGKKNTNLCFHCALSSP